MGDVENENENVLDETREWDDGGVEAILRQFSSTKKSKTEWRRFQHWAWNQARHMHKPIWEDALAEINHKFGHGVAELARIMKWMLMLNLALGLVWYSLVIFPRDYSGGGGVYGVFSHMPSTVAEVVGSWGNGTDKSTLYYSGFERKQGYWVHMDLYYLVAILLTLLISLAAMMNKLGSTDVGDKSASNSALGAAADTPPCKIHTVYIWRLLQGGACI
jgi:hypothetical protein